MAKAITSNTEKVIKKIEKMAVKMDIDIIKVFFYVGEKMTEIARSLPAGQSYEDQTSNLRSSIGYIVTRNSEIVQASSFQAIASSTTQEVGAEGAQIGKEYIESLIGKNDYELIQAAGMEYAKFVQAMPGRDVIMGVELQGEAQLKKLLGRLNKKTYKI